MHVAFANLASSGWTAGGHYLKNLFIALKQLDKPLQPKITLVATLGISKEVYKFLDAYIDDLIFIRETRWQHYWKSVYLRMPIPGWLESLVVPHRDLVNNLKTKQVDILYSNDEYGPSFSIPLLSWIPDFQHKHLPDLFSLPKIQTRNRHNARIARFATRVILSSQDAFHDLEQEFPQAVTKTRVLSFVAQIPNGVYDKDPIEVCNLYSLPKKFFYLPNQFWKHKNHTVVIDALTFIKEQYPDIVVACTGNPAEFRGQGFYSQLVSTIHARGLDKTMLLLGLLPHEDIFQVMRQSLAVIQPSVFEGWSTTIEEAKSLGKSVIASDIPVHVEQNPPGAIYFNPQNPQKLADILVGTYNTKEPGPDIQLERAARDHLALRTRQYAENFIQIASEVVPNKLKLALS